MAHAAALRKILETPTCSVAPGAFDAWSAKLVERAGFEICYLTGFGASASHLGAPDIGLMTSTEMANLAGRVANAISIPVIADADTGYGNTINVRHTAKLYSKAGVAAMQLEDQEFPKRCGHLEDKELISLDDYLSKIRAASDARRDDGFVIIARTDARASLGVEEAVRRCNAALQAGADIAFLEAPQTMDEVQAAPRDISGPCLLNVVRGGKTPEVSFKQASED